MIAYKHVLLAGAFFLAATGTAFADPPTLIGSFKDWSAFQGVAGSNRVCYAMAKPGATLPKKSKRDAIYIMVSDWPGRKAKGEIEIVPGYQYKDGSTVTAQIGKEKFELFTRNEAGEGSAWVEDAAKERQMLAAMEKGARITIMGTSQHGTTTHDTYALGGLSEALSKANAACGM